MDKSYLKGIIPPLVTPIDENELIDEAKLREQIDYVIDNGVHGILAFGSNGEFYMLSDQEYARGIEIFVSQTAGRVPVFCGIGAVSTKKCIALAEMAFSKGADAVSILQPMFLKPTEDELYTHFSMIAKAIAPKPMLLYNNPGRTGYTLSKTLVSRLAHEFENIVGLKDSSGDITQLEEFYRLTRDVDLRIFGGKDTLIYGALVHGAVGAVTSTANYVPKLVLSIYDKYIQGDLKGSFEAQLQLNPIRILTDKASFPVGTKDVANLVGREVGKPYLPTKLTENPAVVGDMKKELERLEKEGLI